MAVQIIMWPRLRFSSLALTKSTGDLLTLQCEENYPKKKKKSDCSQFTQMLGGFFRSFSIRSCFNCWVIILEEIHSDLKTTLLTFAKASLIQPYLNLWTSTGSCTNDNKQVIGMRYWGHAPLTVNDQESNVDSELKHPASYSGPGLFPLSLLGDQEGGMKEKERDNKVWWIVNKANFF